MPMRGVWKSTLTVNRSCSIRYDPVMRKDRLSTLVLYVDIHSYLHHLGGLLATNGCNALADF
jgi:hypothetical protein